MSSKARPAAVAATLAMLVAVMPASARQPDRAATPEAADPADRADAPDKAERPAKPLTDKEPTIVDAAKTPLTDLNIGRDKEIPAVLQVATADPYTLKGLGKCAQLSAAIAELDAALGPDIDLPRSERARISEGRVARWAIASFIPFRGLIREVTGANKQDELVGDAIQAGQTRRGFLKGVGLARKCKYPARPATPAIIRAALVGPPPHSGKAEKEKGDDKGRESKSRYTWEPVVQPVP